MTDNPIVGFIGLGLMGHSIAKNILKGGYELWVNDLNRAPVESLVSLGAHEAAGLKDMAARCDIIQLCLSNSQQVEAVLRGENGVIAGARPGLIVVDSSTSDPGSTEKLAKELVAKGAILVDAPLGRTPKEAEEGTLDAMVGADPETFEKLLPFIQCWAKAIKLIGPVGSGHKMKLIMNFIGMSYGALFAETVVLGAKIGISPQLIREVIAPGRMGNGFFDTFMRYVCDRDRDAHKFSIANAAKDLRYVNNLANDARMQNPIGAAVKQYYTHVEAIGHADDYVPLLSDHVARLSGVNMEEVVRRGAGSTA
jgi:3-hydroxyisobutyrate dehydrogenase-like beta-hydroxyacid dehydrogenase